MTDDQDLRIHCLQMCGGDVGMAIQAYDWIQAEPKAPATDTAEPVHGKDGQVWTGAGWADE